MPDIKLNLVNQALSAIGEDTVSSLTGGDILCRAAIENYDDIAAEELELNQPKFARKPYTPTLLTGLADAPLQYRWQLPSDLLALASVTYNGRTLAGEFYEIEGDVLLCQYNANIKIKYTWGAPEAKWTRRFRAIIKGRLKALFLEVTERHAAAAATNQATDRKAAIARHTDAAQRHGRPLSGGSIVEARQGFRRRRG